MLLQNKLAGVVLRGGPQKEANRELQVVRTSLYMVCKVTTQRLLDNGLANLLARLWSCLASIFTR